MADHRPSSGANHRDSHDLSLSPRDVTRDSLVNNMLMSLDQFSLAQSSQPHRGPSFNYPDSPPRPYGSARPWTNDSNASGRSQEHQYSYSSDFDDDSSRLSSRQSDSRGGSRAQNGTFARLNSIRDAVTRGHTSTSRPMHSRGGKHSNKSSGSASFDAGYVNTSASPRWAPSHDRSASFDFGPQPLPIQLRSQPSTPQHPPPLPSPFRGNGVAITSFLNDDYNSAPTPNIPGGPRQLSSGVSVPPPPPEPIEQPSLERKRSTSRSLKSSSGRTKTATGTRQAAPIMPDADLDSAPAPSVGYGKAKEQMHTGGSPVGTPTQPKERTGFFRRVFGGGSSRNALPISSSQDVSSPSRFPTTPERNTRPGSNKTPQSPLQDAKSKAMSAPPSRDASSSHSNHPALQKKTSSFFRRRKKSVADEAPPVPSSQDVPPVPTISSMNVKPEKDKSAAQKEPSPASSLREVMKPYLRNSGMSRDQSGPLADITNTNAKDDGGEREEYKREFSPDYVPSPNARIRTVQPSDEGRDDQHDQTPTDIALEPPAYISGTRNDSFLNLDGGSDNDDESLRSVTKQSSGQRQESDIERGSPTARKERDRDDTIRGKRRPPELQDQGGADGASRFNLALPIEGARAMTPTSGSTETEYRTAPSAPPSVRIDASGEPSPKVLGTLESMKPKGLDEPEFVIGEPREDDRQKAQKIYDGAEDFIQKDKAAAWMGEEGPVRQRTLQAYMELYVFRDQSVLTALRSVCERLVFRAETQQVDRILVAFAKRWCDCNPNHGFKSTDVIHMLCYSIMLLNTDLHLADIEQKMTRSQFVKNTMTTISQAITESAPSAFETRPSILPEKNSLLSANTSRSSLEQDRKTYRHSFRAPNRSETQSSGMDDENCGPLVKQPFRGTKKAWEDQVEAVLKSIYASIRDERLPLFGAESEKQITNLPSQSSLSVMGVLKRSPSVLSKAPSEGQTSSRGRIAESGRNSASRWTSKSRSRPGVGRNGFSSSRTSFDDGNSLWSPAMSSATWSRYSLGRTQGSMSQDSFGSALRRPDYQQSIGFANALSQAIIRDEDATGLETTPSLLSADLSSTQLLEDESLELSGPPWVKEGMVMHKHHLDGVDKRARDRNWSEVFAVIQKGQMSLFSFNSNKSARQKSRSRTAGKLNAPVGGGNWQDNAANLGTFNLRLTLASALPPPGYSRTRPHVWALSLPTGAVHLFQVGTPEIIKEFVTTVNYWSARLSTHPLVGGISNVEYGWSDAIVNNALVAAVNESDATPVPSGRTSRASGHARKSSVASGSFRSSSFDIGGGAFTNNSGRGKLPGDRIHIAGWSPPTQSTRPSTSTESEQLATLIAYVKSIEEDLQAHNQLRSPMLLAFTPRGHNAGKAMANWERKSAYILREIVKFRTYVDCLQQAEARKKEIYAERDLAQRAARGELSDGDMDVSEDEGDETLRP